MSLTVIALILAAAVCHAGWNLAAKRAGDGGAPLVWLASTAAAVLYAPIALWFIPEFTLPILVALGGSAVIHLAYFLLLQRGYAAGDLSVVYPLARGTGPLLSVAFAVLVLGERPGWVALAGAAAVVAGILVIGGLFSKPASPRLSGVVFGVAAGVLIATYSVWDARAVAGLAIAPLFYDWANESLRVVLLGPVALRQRARVATVWREHWPEVLAIGVLSPLAYILVLVAYTMAPVSVVAPARELSIVIGSLFGWLLLREAQPMRRLTGAAVVLAGIAALATAR